MQFHLSVSQKTLNLFVLLAIGMLLNTAQLLKMIKISMANGQETHEVVATSLHSFRTTSKKIEIEKSEKAFMGNSTFSACLLVKDDNEILTEWLAYHYFTLKMRKLIIAIDPESTESPSSILSKWKANTDLEITEWSDLDYMPEAFITDGIAPKQFLVPKKKMSGDTSDEAVRQVSNHRYRQRVFLSQCLMRLKDEGRNWVLHVDTDEYVVPSKMFHELKETSIDPPKMSVPGELMKFVRKSSNNRRKQSNVRYPCITMWRYLYGSIEDPNIQIDSSFDPVSFETLRFHHRAAADFKMNGNPKVILDVAAIPHSLLSKDIVFSIHRPFKELCRRKDDIDYNNIDEHPLAVNHYLGSWERYNSRSDARRSSDLYKLKAQVNDAHDTVVSPWLDGFVHFMGKEKAELLLENHLSRNARK